MVFSNNSSLWNDIQSRGILTYQYISSIHYKTNSLSPNLFSQSPSSPNVKRKLFTNTTQVFFFSLFIFFKYFIFNNLF